MASMRLPMTNTSGRSASELARAQRRALHRPDEGRAHPALLEGRDARDGSAARRADHVLERGRVHAGLARSLAAPRTLWGASVIAGARSGPLFTPPSAGAPVPT